MKQADSFSEFTVQDLRHCKTKLLSELTGIHHTHFCHWINSGDTVSDKSLAKIANAVGLSIEQVLQVFSLRRYDVQTRLEADQKVQLHLSKQQSFKKEQKRREKPEKPEKLSQTLLNYSNKQTNLSNTDEITCDVYGSESQSSVKSIREHLCLF